MINLVQRTNPLKGVKMLIVYLGNKCNFDCVYCDRGYIESLGGQATSSSTADNMKSFFEWAASQENEITRVSFHGGEPLLFVKRMDQILEWLSPLADKSGWQISMTTNGSLIKENEWLFKKYNKKLIATISYDFMFQDKNRESFDVVEMSEVLNAYGNGWQWQFVLPINDKKAFSFESLQNVVSTCYKTKCNVVNIIPLRHHRGKDKFNVLIDDVDLEQFFGALLDYLQILYIKKIDAYIDGNYSSIDKAYFGEHNKLILSPDGYMYPEFDFLEYKLEEFRIGSWIHNQVWVPKGDEDKVLDGCKTCSQKSLCGLKYLYKLFDEQPNGSCKKFYTYLNYAIMHNAQLKKKNNILQWVGIDQEFPINE
jgi:sulfatase maturation enzyme AslB (radical SAM superfamily)